MPPPRRPRTLMATNGFGNPCHETRPCLLTQVGESCCDAVGRVRTDAVTCTRLASASWLLGLAMFGGGSRRLPGFLTRCRRFPARFSVSPGSLRKRKMVLRRINSRAYRSRSFAAWLNCLVWPYQSACFFTVTGPTLGMWLERAFATAMPRDMKCPGQID